MNAVLWKTGTLEGSVKFRRHRNRVAGKNKNQQGGRRDRRKKGARDRLTNVKHKNYLILEPMLYVVSVKPYL